MIFIVKHIFLSLQFYFIGDEAWSGLKLFLAKRQIRKIAATTYFFLGAFFGGLFMGDTDLVIVRPSFSCFLSFTFVSEFA